MRLLLHSRLGRTKGVVHEWDRRMSLTYKFILVNTQEGACAIGMIQAVV